MLARGDERGGGYGVKMMRGEWIEDERWGMSWDWIGLWGEGWDGKDQGGGEVWIGGMSSEWGFWMGGGWEGLGRAACGGKDVKR